MKNRLFLSSLVILLFPIVIAIFLLLNTNWNTPWNKPIPPLYSNNETFAYDEFPGNFSEINEYYKGFFCMERFAAIKGEEACQLYGIKGTNCWHHGKCKVWVKVAIHESCKFNKFDEIICFD